jgi:hypothetical protein
MQFMNASLARLRAITENVWLVLLAGFLLGIFALATIRFITFSSENVHYHANFALYIDGERDDFDSFTFYEEVQACVAGDEIKPESRVHMHNRENDVIHVHTDGVTWGHFFANLGYTLGDNILRTDNTTFVDGENGKELSFILNGEQTSSVANRLISNEDRLLVSYGDEPADELQGRFRAITHNAGEYNSKHDPSGCAGNEELTFEERLKQAIGIGGSH